MQSEKWSEEMEQQKCAERREETNVRNVQPEIIKLCYNVAKHC